jgi:UDP-N-acetylmuramoyl-tripeptide--D-alanyl-D-alanine ligase
MNAPRVAITAVEAAAVMNGQIVSGDPDTSIGGVSIDSRTLSPGDLFFAIRGERFDGEAFVAAAYGAGALGVVTTNTAARELSGGRLAIVVSDTTRGLQALANHVRRASGSKVVAITGSAGKTTTKEVTAEFLSARYAVFRNRGNLNNHIGLPLSLLALRDRPDVAVVELGMNHAGEIRTLTAVAEPEVRVWTNVGDAHLEFFGSKEAIASAKAEILEGATADALVVANADDPLVMAHVRRFGGRVRTFGFDPHADIRAADIRDRGLAGTTANVQTPAGHAAMHVPLLGRANLANVLAATAVAVHFDVPLQDIVDRAGTLKPAAHRGHVIRLRDGVVVLDDSYNSNPTALTRTLSVVAAESSHARKIAVIGEMLELGESSRALHEECGRAAAASGLARLIAVGGAPAAALAAAAITAGLERSAVTHVADSAAAADLTLATLRAGDLLMVKGSRGVRTDVVVDRVVEAWS